ncbi:hypothetical protein M3E13_12875 [Oceanobacillus kimchii]|uniref:hypothetical protein n=1 Tax=Oceanobacillus TaxID=182709 RepID=UPI0009BAAD42|nr:MULTISPECIES: hypothetical protein [Oceanobacillus]MCT1577815.1 hypothetical protein [Oceanobacillus kimchii]MCT2136803.1 hypothetical protein [Oceanobacillus kimchii]
MSKKYVKYSIVIGIVTFAISLMLFLTIDSPSPYLGGLVVAFLIFEISFYHFSGKERQKTNCKNNLF